MTPGDQLIKPFALPFHRAGLTNDQKQVLRQNDVTQKQIERSTETEETVIIDKTLILSYLVFIVSRAWHKRVGMHIMKGMNYGALLLKDLDMNYDWSPYPEMVFMPFLSLLCVFFT